MDSVERLEAVTEIVEKIRATYPDAKKLKLEVYYEWQETDQQDLDNALCPVVKIEIER